MKRSIFVLVILLSSANLFAQLSRAIPPLSLSVDVESNIPVFQMPALDNDALLNLYPDNADNEKLRFAEPIPVKISLTEDGVWTELPNGDRIARLRILSPGALSLNFLYESFWLPPGSRYHIYDVDYDEVLGAFTSRNNKPDGKFATAVVHRDETILEYYEPAGVKDQGSIVINQVGHGFRGLFLTSESTSELGPGDSGGCQVDINCIEGTNWQDDKKAVARMTLNGADHCTGTLIQNINGDCLPYFLSANHCMSSYDAVSNPSTSGFVFYFNYEYSGCQSPSTVPSETVSGGTLVANDSPSDFALIELLENPVDDAYDVYFAGWDARSQTPVSGGVGIHHPSGDVKKIATHTQTPNSTNWGGGPPNTHWTVNWDATTNGHSVTEGGSSGSPIFDSNHRIIGQLHGGSSINCSDPANDPGTYGKVSYSWDNTGNTNNSRKLQPWLDPGNTGIQFVDGGYPGTCPSFVRINTADMSVDEGSDCSMQNITVSIGTTAPPTVATTVTFGISGSAVAGVDYAPITTTQMTFPVGSTANQNIVIPIFQDGETEGDKDLVLTLQSVSGDPNIQIAANPSFSLEIKDDDPVPSPVSSGTVTIGQGALTSTGAYTPFYGFYEDKRLQILYRASELQALGISAGNIDELAFNVTSIGSTQNYGNFNIAMGHTSGTTTNPDNFASGLSNVYSNPSYDPFIGWNNFVFSTPFVWNGNDNVIIEVCYDNGSWTQSDAVTYDALGYDAIAYEFVDGGVGCSLNADFSAAGRPQVQLGAQSGTSIQTQVNTSTDLNIGPGATVHFRDPTTNSIMATVENLSAVDLGCCQLNVNQSGTAGNPWIQGSTTSDKSFQFISGNPNASATLKIDLYYTDNEVNNFPVSITGVGSSQSNFSINNLATQTDVHPQVSSSFGTHSVFTFNTTSDQQFFALTDRVLCSSIPPTGSIALEGRVFLGGCYDDATGLMRDDLRANNLIPLTEPYTSLPNFTHIIGGGETISPTVLTTTGSKAVVDWIFIELRSSTNVLIETRSALLLRDGSISEVDGDECTPLVFFAPGNTDYYLVLRHRNHLGVMSANPINFGTSVSTVVDFSSLTADVPVNSMKVAGNSFVLWAGNGDGNDKIVYQGSGSDILPITSQVFTDPANSNFQLSFPSLGYHSADYDMNGKVIYQGFGSDIVPVTQSVFSNPLNSSFEFSFPVAEQIP